MKNSGLQVNAVVADEQVAALVPQAKQLPLDK